MDLPPGHPAAWAAVGNPSPISGSRPALPRACSFSRTCRAPCYSKDCLGRSCCCHEQSGTLLYSSQGGVAESALHSNAT